MSELLGLFNSEGSSLVRGQPPAESTSKLASQIVGLVRGLLELLSQLLLLSLIVNSQNNSNRLSDVLTKAG